MLKQTTYKTPSLRHNATKCPFYSPKAENYDLPSYYKQSKINFKNSYSYCGKLENKAKFPKKANRKYYHEDLVELPSSPITKTSLDKILSKDSDNYSTSNEDNSLSLSIYKSKAEDFKAKYKTELCKYYQIEGNCKYGDYCAYAHGKENLRTKVTNKLHYKTKNCYQFFEYGYCPYGNRCQFAHALKSNIINNLNGDEITYTEIIKGFDKIENEERIIKIRDKGRLDVFEEITKGNEWINSNCTLIDDIKKMKKKDIVDREDDCGI